MKRVLVLTFLILAIGLQVGYAQAGCATSPCTDPVPCAQCTGTWADDYGGVWSISSDTALNVTGSLKVFGGGSCPDQTYTVSGTLTLNAGAGGANGYSTIHLEASGPQPGSTADCEVTFWATLDGNIQNQGCDLIPAPFATLTTEFETDGTGFDKSPDIPSGENAAFRTWSPDYPTVGQWQGNLSSAVDLGGRQVSESQPTPSTDNCFSQVPDSIYAQAALSGGWWNVGFSFQNAFNDDYVGWFPDAVTYYRANVAVLPCSARILQQMNIAYDGNNALTQSYTAQYLTWYMDAFNVGSGKAGNIVYRMWP